MLGNVMHKTHITHVKWSSVCELQENRILNGVEY